MTKGHPVLPTDDEGHIITSAIFGMQWLVEVVYNTDPDGNWVDDDDYSNKTLHGPFVSEDEAVQWIDAYPDGDRDLKDISVLGMNAVRPGVPASKSSTCRHCHRGIQFVDDRWIDPEATGDDVIWRETCADNHEDRIAAHEPYEPGDEFPQSIEEARICVHGNVVWQGHYCKECDASETGYVWAEEQVTYLMTDQPMDCPRCQTRTEFFEISILKQKHTCPNPACGYVFIAEWDPEELDEHGNWVDPSDDNDNEEKN